jgi:hypothetical protein
MASDSIADTKGGISFLHTTGRRKREPALASDSIVQTRGGGFFEQYWWAEKEASNSTCSYFSTF